MDSKDALVAISDASVAVSDTSQLLLNDDDVDTSLDIPPPRRRRNSRYSISKAMHLKHRYGLYSCIRLIIAITIGSGIFTSPTQVVKAVGNDSWSLCIWFAYGIFNMIGALCYIELGTTFPVSSGNYAYLNECFGSFFGFLYQWSSNLVFVPMVNAIMAIVVAIYIAKPYVGASDGNEDGIVIVVALSTIMFVCFMVCYSPKLTLKIQLIIFYMKLTSIGVILFCGMINLYKNGLYKYTNFTFEFNEAYNIEIHKHTDEDDSYDDDDAEHHRAGGIVNALYQASYSYLGFYYLTFISEEIRSLRKTLPIAMGISAPIVMIIYLLVNFCYFISLSPEDIGKSEIIASDMLGTVLPESAYQYTNWMLPLLIACGVMGTLSVHVGACARIAFVGARNRHVPQVLALLQVQHYTPVVAVTFTGMIACLYIFTVKLEYLLEVATHLELAFISLTVYALIFMRIKRPEIERPFKIPLILPIFYAIVSTILFFTPVLTIILDFTTAGHTHTEQDKSYGSIHNVRSMAGAFFVVVTGIPIFCLFIKRQPPHWIRRINKKVIIFVQKVVVSLPERGHNFKDE